MAYKEYDGSRYTCTELKLIVKREKIALISGTRYVSKKSYCASNEKAVDNAYIVSKDNSWCNPSTMCRVKFGGE